MPPTVSPTPPAPCLDCNVSLCPQFEGEERPRSSSSSLTRNSVQRAPAQPAPAPAARPAPAALQEVVNRPSTGRGQRPQQQQQQQRAQQQPQRAQPVTTEAAVPAPAPQPAAALPARLTPIRIQPQPAPTSAPQTERPARFEVRAKDQILNMSKKCSYYGYKKCLKCAWFQLLPNRPSFRSPFRQSQTTSTSPAPAPAPARARPFSSGRNTSPRLSFSSNRCWDQIFLAHPSKYFLQVPSHPHHHHHNNHYHHHHSGQQSARVRPASSSEGCTRAQR